MFNFKIMIFTDFINYDILEKIIDYSDAQSSINFLFACKKTNQLYSCDRKFFDKIILSKILSNLNLNHLIDEIPKSKACFNQLIMLSKNFENHSNSPIADYLIHIIDNYRIKTSRTQTSAYQDLFSTLVEHCDFTENMYSNDICTIHASDMKYMLTFSDISLFKILLSKFQISSFLLLYVIRSLLVEEHRVKRRQNDIKILLIIKYIVFKYHFKNFNNINFINFQNILLELIFYNKVKLFADIFKLKRKYNIRFEYNLLINKAIEYDLSDMLKLIFDEYRGDNRESLIINPDSICRMIQKGHFSSLSFMLKYILGDFINLRRYITAICGGLSKFNFYPYTELNTYPKYENLQCLKEYLTYENKCLINTHINIITNSSVYYII